jgi:hypothetical protein
MSALFRLLERQGLLQGDMNYLQRLALQEVIKREVKDENMKEKIRFRFQTALKYPDSARKIFAENDDEFDVPDIEEYDPDNPGYSQDSVDTMLATLEQFGIHAEIMEEND